MSANISKFSASNLRTSGIIQNNQLLPFCKGNVLLSFVSARNNVLFKKNSMTKIALRTSQLKEITSVDSENKNLFCFSLLTGQLQVFVSSLT